MWDRGPRTLTDEPTPSKLTALAHNRWAGAMSNILFRESCIIRAGRDVSKSSDEGP